MKKILLLLFIILSITKIAFSQEKIKKDSLILLDTIRYVPEQKVEKFNLQSQSFNAGSLRVGIDPIGIDPEEDPNPNPYPQPSSVPTAQIDAGRTQSLIDVSNTGSATFAVPISIPAGVNGVAPKISLTYSSQSGNGIAGYGWNIGGLSSITRIAASKNLDNYIGAINNNGGDKFALDGQRLILKSGIYGEEGAVYETENYSNVKIVSRSYYGYGGGLIYFEVFYPDGSKAVYGSNYNSNSTLQYGIDYLENPQGLRINYYYTNSYNVLYLDQIQYGNIAINTITFEYKNRTLKEQQAVAGVSTYLDKILSKIKVYGYGIPYRNYELNHNLINNLNYERVESIVELNGDNTKSFQPITFSYDADSYIHILPTGYAQIGLTGVASNNSDVITGDFTGNGTLDFVVYPNSKNKYWLMRDPDVSSPYNFIEEVNTGYFQEIFPVNWLTSNNKLYPGTGLSLVKNQSSNEVKFQVISTVSYAGGLLQYEKTWSNAPTSNTYYSECLNDYTTEGFAIPKKYISGDFNGDGLTDLIAITTPYSQTDYERRVQCTDWWDTDCCEQDFHLVQDAKVYLINLDRRIATNFVSLTGMLAKAANSNNIFSGDFNGDGKTDIIQILAGEVYVYEIDNNGNLSLLKHQINNRFTITLPPYLGDYNGDGKIDIILPTANNSNSFAVFMSNGKEFAYQLQNMPFTFKYDIISGGNIEETKLIPTDINNDGKTDFISLKINTYNSTTQGSLALTTYNNLGAFNSGFPQFVYGSYDYQSTYLRHRPIPLFLNSQKTNFKLEFGVLSDNRMIMYNFTQNVKEKSLIRSIGQDDVTYQVEYKDLIYDPNSYDLQVYEDSWDQTYPFVDIHSAPGLKVVTKLKKFYLLNSTQQVFGYKAAVTNADGLGFLGFSQIIKSNWHVDASDQNQMFNISIMDMQKRGALKQSFTTKSSYLNSSITNTNISTPTFDGNGNPIFNNSTSGVGDGAAINDYINRTDYTYQTVLTPNKVFINVPTLSSTKDLLNGTNTTILNVYDSYYNLTKEFSDFSGQGSKKVEITYDNNITSSYYIGRPTNKKTTLTNPIDTYTTEEQYFYTGFLPTQIKRKGNGTAFITENIQYDGFGNITRKGITIPSGVERASSMQYEASGKFVTKSIDIDGLETNYTYDIFFGNVLTVTNPFGLVTSSAYDSWGRLVENTDYLGKKSYRSYNFIGGGFMSIQNNDDEGGESYTLINALGQTEEVRTKDVLGQFIGKAYQYDAYGREVKVSEPAFGSSYTQWNEKVFDSYGRLSQAIAFTGKTTNITYNGLTVTVNDGTKSVTTTKNALDQVVTSQDPGGIINYTYFANGNLKSSSYAGNVQTIEQDGWGRKTKLTDPSAGVYNYTYNDFGEALTENTPKGTTTYTHDDYGKVLTKHIVGDLTNMSYLYTYDSSSKLLTSLNLSSTVSNDGNNSNYTYTYDTYKRLISKVENNPFATFTKNFTYDPFGRIDTEETIALDKLSSKTVSKTIQNNYQYGELSSNTDMGTAETIQEIAGLNARGQATLVYQAGYNTKQTYTYDQYGFVEEIKINKITGVLGELMRLNYSFDAQRGNLMSRSNSVFAWNENFAYDSQDRLTDFNDNNGNFSQSYSSNGTITTNSKLGTYTYNGYQQTGLNNLTQTAMDHYNDRRLQQISYNAFKSPVEIAEQGKEKISFWYNAAQGRSHRFYGDENADPLQRRLRKHYSDDGSVEITKDLVSGTTSFVLYIAGDAYSAPAIWKEDYNAGTQINSQMYYLHRDYLGSILSITDDQGASKEQRHFDAWGNIVKLTDGNGNNLIDFAILDRGYTGHEHLSKVGLIHMNGRLYDPLLHRFLSPDNYVQDPSNTQNYNRYGYVLNNPLSHVDPSGEFIVEAIIIGAAIFSYLGGTAANNGQFNPTKWDWSSGKTWGGIGIGAVAGGLGGWGFAVAGPALAGSAFFGSFSNGTIAAYGLAGTLAGGSAGYLTGFGTGMIVSNGDWGYANKLGGLYGSIGAAVGSVIGTAYGFTEEGRKYLEDQPEYWVSTDQIKYQNNRPDADGYITLSEANEWYRKGNGNSLYADLGKIDLAFIKESDFRGKGVNYFQTLFKSKDGRVYGNIGLKLLNGALFGSYDYYDFDIKPYTKNTKQTPFSLIVRNFGTGVGSWLAGKGIPYYIYFYGSYPIKK
ncbi:RHS repeat-associated core domain-containing protein [Pedobacter alpinus]|uniref:RHS repeat-associated core domain-containing protein n=1 Tax=Pedobacter alpinus TaxID=1590643 RepID=A0ABW5TRQ4_9SPHI